ncbi:hypothetical protein [Bradyrhizobium sp. RDM4]|uniref:hypothetical protein n=1 Tax=Bradyrhizobium sp. RDM4 TaxID=3378765 RepID=UPI0038FC2285
MAGIDPAVADADLVPALVRAFREFGLRSSRIDHKSWLRGLFLMTRGHLVEAEIGQAIAAGLCEQRVRLPHDETRAAAWVKEPYRF